MSESVISNSSDGEAAPVERLTFEQRVQHFSAGYANSQSVVHFLDAKAGAVIGVVPVLLGLLAAVFTWLQGSWDWKEVIAATGTWLPTLFGVVILLLAAVLLALAWRTVATAFFAISPQDTGDVPPSVIFPFQGKLDNIKGSQNPVSPPVEDFVTRAAHMAVDGTHADAIEDYRRQVVRMAQIVAQKYDYVNGAVHCLKWLFLVAALTLLVMLVMAGASALLSLDGAGADVREVALNAACTEFAEHVRALGTT